TPHPPYEATRAAPPTCGQSAASNAARLSIMGKPGVHREITARDPRELETYYRQMFDWRVDETPLAYRRVDTGAGINGGIAETDGSWPSGALFYVQVVDLQSYIDKAERLGALTLLPPSEMEDARIAIIRDPEGFRVGLMERADARADARGDELRGRELRA